MQVIVGLGNPGQNYNFTRHNFGFLALDFHAKLNQFTFKDHSKFHAQIHHDSTINRLYVKPQTFYNEIGQTLSAIRSFYKISPSDFLIICDDFDLDFGQIRFREKGSAGGNNGLKSAIKHLGTESFPRLRLGTNNPSYRQKLGDVDFVLSKFTPDERDRLPDLLSQVHVFLEEY